MYFTSSGSGIENWHSIIREGLLVGSGTKLQVGKITSSGIDSLFYTVSYWTFIIGINSILSHNFYENMYKLGWTVYAL